MENNSPNTKRPKYSWVLVILLLIFFWPLGFVFLFINLADGSEIKLPSTENAKAEARLKRAQAKEQELKNDAKTAEMLREEELRNSELRAELERVKNKSKKKAENKG